MDPGDFGYLLCNFWLEIGGGHLPAPAPLEVTSHINLCSDCWNYIAQQFPNSGLFARVDYYILADRYWQIFDLGHLRSRFRFLVILLHEPDHGNRKHGEIVFGTALISSF